MEIFDEIFHEGGGSRVPFKFFSRIFFQTIENHSLTVETCFSHMCVHKGVGRCGPTLTGSFHFKFPFCFSEPFPYHVA